MLSSWSLGRQCRRWNPSVHLGNVLKIPFSDQARPDREIQNLTDYYIMYIVGRVYNQINKMDIFKTTQHFRLFYNRKIFWFDEYILLEIIGRLVARWLEHLKY